MLTQQNVQLITASLNLALKNEPDALTASQVYTKAAENVINTYQLQKAKEAGAEEMKKEAEQDNIIDPAKAKGIAQ